VHHNRAEALLLSEFRGKYVLVDFWGHVVRPLASGTAVSEDGLFIGRAK
jgi:hypothetical protein